MEMLALIEQFFGRIATESTLTALICLLGWFLERQNSGRLTKHMERSNERISALTEALIALKERIQ
jgi:hypothetical protein